MKTPALAFLLSAAGAAAGAAATPLPAAAFAYTQTLPLDWRIAWLNAHFGR